MRVFLASIIGNAVAGAIVGKVLFALVACGGDISPEPDAIAVDAAADVVGCLPAKEVCDQ
jgi:hypothetical protein